jgi:hypothetical protein
MTNYKIKLTADNREAIKEIAERKGMNKRGYSFSGKHIDGYYTIDVGQFSSYYMPKNTIYITPHYTEITFNQFKEIFDKENVSLVGRYFEALVDEAEYAPTIKGGFYLIENENIVDIMFKVPHLDEPHGFFHLQKINENKLYKLMPIGFDPNKQETPSNGVPFDEEKTKGTADIHIGSETVVGNTFENRKIIGYKAPFDLGGHNVKGLVFKLTPSDFGRWYDCKYGNIISPSEISMPSEIVETWEAVYEEPKPEETDFKSKVIELVRRATCNAEQSKNIELEEKEYGQAMLWQIKYEALSDILAQIKELN